MAGGTFLTMNKALPGAYINFKSVPAPIGALGARGTATMPLPLSWGPEDEIITLLSSDLIDGSSLAKVGATAVSEGSLLLRECLKNCYKLHVWRIDKGGVKATATLGSLTATAKYAGTFGNELRVAIKKDGTNYEVSTILGLQTLDKQIVVSIAGLASNDYIDFSGEGTLTVNAGTTLSGGTNGTVAVANYTAFLDRLKTLDYQVAGFPTDDNKIPPLVTEFIKNQRDNVGKKVQAVVYNYNTADHEGVISPKQGYKTEIETVAPVDFIATVTGMAAGANVNESNAYKIIPGAIEIIGELTEDELSEQIQQGWFLLTKRVDGVIVVLDDINSFVSFTSEKDIDFGNNRVIRVFDEIGNTTRLIFEKYFSGKENNDITGRDNLKIQLIANFKVLQDIRAIQNFKAEDIVITAGPGKADVKADAYIQPTDSMKKLYMTIYER